MRGRSLKFIRDETEPVAIGRFRVLGFEFWVFTVSCLVVLNTAIQPLRRYDS